jgi:hypothetical protein
MEVQLETCYDAICNRHIHRQYAPRSIQRCRAYGDIRQQSNKRQGHTNRATHSLNACKARRRAHGVQANSLVKYLRSTATASICRSRGVLTIACRWKGFSAEVLPFHPEEGARRDNEAQYGLASLSEAGGGLGRRGASSTSNAAIDDMITPRESTIHCVRDCESSPPTRPE